MSVTKEELRELLKEYLEVRVEQVTLMGPNETLEVSLLFDGEFVSKDFVYLPECDHEC